MSSTPFNIAAAAYGNAGRLVGAATRPEAETTIAAVSGGPNFAQMLAQSVQGLADSDRAADPSFVAMLGDTASAMLSKAALPGAPLGSASGSVDQDFAQMLAQSVQGVVDTGRRSDQMSMDMVNGKANVVDMVTALSEAEMTMQSMVTIRDRVIASYEEIMRMSI